MSLTQQTLKQIMLPVQKLPSQNNQTTKVNPDGYRTVSKFGENGHGVYNPNQKYGQTSPIVPTGFY